MLLLTTPAVPGKQIEALGLVQGAMIQSKHIGKDLGASFKSIVGGELKGYTEMMEESRAMATQRMVEEAQRLGADAVVNMRYATSSIVQGAAEVLAYGTAVKIVG